MKPDSTNRSVMPTTPPVSVEAWSKPRAGSRVEPSASTSAPTHEQIARRAYAIYEQSGRQPGRCRQNWLQAERGLRQETPGAGDADRDETPVAAHGDTESVVHSIAGEMFPRRSDQGSNGEGASAAGFGRRRARR